MNIKQSFNIFIVHTINNVWLTKRTKTVFVCVSGFIPAPIIMGHMVDQTCILWQKTCGVSGACLLYDTAAFRYLIHGVTLVVGIIDLGLMIILSIWLHREQQQQQQNEKGTPISGVIVDAEQAGDVNSDDLDAHLSEKQSLQNNDNDDSSPDDSDKDSTDTAAEMSISQSRILFSTSHPELTNF